MAYLMTCIISQDLDSGRRLLIPINCLLITIWALWYMHTQKKHTQTYTYVHTQIINNKINIKSTKYEQTESKQCTTRIIPHYQIGFIPNMWGWFNIQASIRITHHINQLKNSNSAAISTDTSKPLKNILYSFMI